MNCAHIFVYICIPASMQQFSPARILKRSVKACFLTSPVVGRIFKSSSTAPPSIVPVSSSLLLKAYANGSTRSTRWNRCTTLWIFLISTWLQSAWLGNVGPQCQILTQFKWPCEEAWSSPTPVFSPFSIAYKPVSNHPPSIEWISSLLLFKVWSMLMELLDTEKSIQLSSISSHFPSCLLWCSVMLVMDWSCS